MTENGQPAADIQTEQSTPHEAEELTSTSVTVPVIIKDFGFLPIPRRLRREDSSKAIGFGLVLNVGFGIASTFTVANLYYCQPLLVKMAQDFGVSYSAISRIPTLVQAGYAVGILLLSPMGDLVRRRPLLLLIVLVSASLTIGLSVTKKLVVFEALSFLTGMFTVTPQILLPLAADLAPPERRAAALSVVLAGLLLGILAARVIAGIIAEFASWRIVYFMSIGLQFFVLSMLYFIIPDVPAKNAHLRYHEILYTMAKFAVTEPILIQAMFINLLSSACFSNFWVTLTFLLDGSPYHYSTLVIGLFGLIGIAGVSAAPFTGRLIDNMIPWCSTVITSLGLLLFTGIQTGFAGINVSAVILVCFFTDVLRQMQQVSLTTVVMGTEPSASARLNAVLILFVFIGQVMGTSVGTEVFVKYGWRPAAALSVGWTGLQLLILLMRGPHCERYTWFGYQHGLETNKKKAAENKRMREGGGVQPSASQTWVDEEKALDHNTK